MAISLKQDLVVVDSSTIVSDVHTTLQLKTGHAKEFLRIALANSLLFDRKQQDYGPDNISEYGTFGCVIRASDKFKRLKHLYHAGRRRKAINESIEDTFRDIGNYMNISLICELGRWSNE